MILVLGDIDEQIMRVAMIDSCPEREKYVIILIDEMHIKANLVYDKHSGTSICFLFCLNSMHTCTYTHRGNGWLYRHW